MSKIWNNFSELHGGNFLARDVFEELCYKFLDKHYPGKGIVSVNDISKSNPDNLNVVFISKFFTDELTNSRRGQIRRAFNKFLAYKEENNLKVYKWVFCVSYTLNNDELMWWLAWKEKMVQKSEVNIEIFDGDIIVERAKKYGLYEEWFVKKENKEEDKIEKKEEGKIEKKVNVIIENKEEGKIEKKENDEKENKEEDKIEKKENKEEDKIEKKENKEEDKIEKKENVIIEKKEDDELENKKEDKIEKKENDEKENKENVILEKKEISFELIPDKKIENKKITLINEKLKKQKEIRKQELEKKKIEKELQKQVSKQEKKKEEIQQDKTKKEKKRIKPAKKIVNQAPLAKYEKLNSQYNKIKEFANKLSKKEKLELKEISSLHKWDNLFVIKDNLDISILKLFYKAKSYEIRKKYVHAVYVYEEIFKKDNYKEILKFKSEDLYKALEKCQKNVQAILNELEGDVYAVRKNYIKAVDFYEISYTLNKNNKTYAKKFYETLGDNQIENDLPNEAVNSYEAALKNDKTNEDLERKLQNAKYLANGKKYFKSSPLSLLNIFISPFAYWAAHSTIKKEATKEKLNTSSRKFAFVFASLMLLFVVIFFVFNTDFTFKNTKIKQDKILVQNEIFIKPLSLDKVAVAYGNEIMNNISYKQIHLIDTAIAAYKRALAYNSKNENAYLQLKKADDYKKEYLSNAQANIRLDSVAYFISMRRSSENLRLFKYLFNPNDKSEGKYGFVDSNMQIVIPPVYDFNYNIMYKGNENFINGEAFICLVHSKGDTNYYKINKRNQMIKKL